MWYKLISFTLRAFYTLHNSSRWFFVYSNSYYKFPFDFCLYNIIWIKYQRALVQKGANMFHQCVYIYKKLYYQCETSWMTFYNFWTPNSHFHFLASNDPSYKLYFQRHPLLLLFNNWYTFYMVRVFLFRFVSLLWNNSVQIELWFEGACVRLHESIENL